MVEEGLDKIGVEDEVVIENLRKNYDQIQADFVLVVSQLATVAVSNMEKIEESKANV